MNSAVTFFNQNLKTAVEEFNKNLTGAKFTYINVFDTFPLEVDEEGKSKHCPTMEECRAANGAPMLGTGPLMRCCKDIVPETGLCRENEKPCPIRIITPFFDNFHPTEVANRLVAAGQFKAIRDIHAQPYDISTLASL